MDERVRQSPLTDDLVVEFTAPLWRWEARREFWTFVSLPGSVTDELREFAGDTPRGFGALRVLARIGTSSWRTSIFPQDAAGPYVLPVKRAVRQANDLELDDEVPVWLQLLP